MNYFVNILLLKRAFLIIKTVKPPHNLMLFKQRDKHENQIIAR